MPCVNPTKVGHVVYRTRRFDEMLRWYQTVFNARVQYQSPAVAFLTFDDEHHRFGIINLAAFPPGGSDVDQKGATGVDHVGYTYASLRDLLENYADLKESGITPYWCVHHGVTVALYYADPDGNQMEFQVDCLASAEEARAFMTSQFNLNPPGVEYDPEEWLARLRAGAPESDLLVHRSHEPVSTGQRVISRVAAEA